MAKIEQDRYELTDAEKRDLIKLIAVEQRFHRVIDGRCRRRDMTGTANVNRTVSITREPV